MGPCLILSCRNINACTLIFITQRRERTAVTICQRSDKTETAHRASRDSTVLKAQKYPICSRILNLALRDNTEGFTMNRYSMYINTGVISIWIKRNQLFRIT
uniref:Uncharacterized protein n=1 Tax=Siphoviridae sp. ctgN495 TaxID=2825608 RepID=A0A8S5UCQ7_9CAUD|nr:MAG TPA: hypothetical protein [Siphoviridae sp. ctgN495]